MINCNTPISSLTHKESSLVVELTFNWCVKNMGFKKKKGLPELKVSKKKFKTDPFYGDYVDAKHRITIYPHTFSELGNCVRKLIAIVIHEYAHTLQKGGFKTYNKMYQKYGYWNHPMEIEAREYEKVWNLCYRDIKQFLP